jgi:hypothetical protein
MEKPHASDVEVIHQLIIPVLKTFIVSVFCKRSLDIIIVPCEGLKDGPDIDLVDFKGNLHSRGVRKCGHIHP